VCVCVCVLLLCMCVSMSVVPVRGATYSEVVVQLDSGTIEGMVGGCVCVCVCVLTSVERVCARGTYIHIPLD